MTTIANQLQALANHMDTITDEALSITTHNNLCDLAKAPQHLYATINIDSRHFEQLQQQLTDFIYNK